MIISTRTSWLGSCAVLLMLCSLVGCGSVKEKSAPCKRPTNLTSYAEDPRRECGPMALVNIDYARALAAIDAITTQ